MLAPLRCYPGHALSHRFGLAFWSAVFRFEECLVIVKGTLGRRARRFDLSRTSAFFGCRGRLNWHGLAFHSLLVTFIFLHVHGHRGVGPRERVAICLHVDKHGSSYRGRFCDTTRECVRSKCKQQRVRLVSFHCVYSLIKIFFHIIGLSTSRYSMPPTYSHAPPRATLCHNPKSLRMEGSYAYKTPAFSIPAAAAAVIC